MAKQVKSSKQQPKKATPAKKAVAKSLPEKPVKKTAAYDDDMTDAFIMEVDDEVKSDNFKAFFNKYGLYIISIVAIVLFATVSFDQIKNWRENQFREKTNAYIAANYAPTTQEKIHVLEYELEKLNQLTDDNFALLSKGLTCLSTKTGKPLSPREKIQLCQIMEIFQSAHIDISKIKTSVEQGEIDLNMTKQIIQDEILKAAGVNPDDKISIKNNKKFNEEFSQKWQLGERRSNYCN